MTNRGGRVFAIEKSFVYLSYSTASKLGFAEFDTRRFIVDGYRTFGKIIV